MSTESHASQLDQDVRTTGLSSRRSLIVLLVVAIGLTVAVVAGFWRAESPIDGTPISVDELPDGLGRGFPVASVAGIDNTGTGMNRGDMAPDFRLVTEQSGVVDLQDLRGRPVMLNFWATWCGPCRMEMPDIVAQSEVHDDLVVLAINVQEDLEDIQPFAEEFQISMPVVQDREGALRKLYQVRGMPTSIFINREGEVQDTWSGLLTAELLQDLLGNIL